MYMLLLPSTTSPSVASKRQAAWRESIRDGSAGRDFIGSI
jgi:hypothetical protein